MARLARVFLFLAVLSSISFSWAAWPDDPALNLVVCNRNGEQTIPKVAPTSDGGCYIGWHDHASGNYDIYLQRLNSDGVPQWQQNGILIDGHPQNSWLTDWDLTVDSQDYCIIAINDIRAGTDWDIYGYRISPTGEFAWGPDGVTLSNNDGFEPTPRVVATTGGNAVFAWQEEVTDGNVIHLRKISPSGQDVWNPPTITLVSPTQYGLSIPRIAPSDHDGVILQYLVHQSGGMYAIRHIYAQKFDSMGTALWQQDGVLVSDAGGLSGFMFPDLISDGAGGAISFWYDTHDANRHHVFVQHIDSGGNMLWTANGVRTSQSASELQMSPGLAYLPTSGDVFVFYQVTDLGQTQNGLGGQRINAAGAVQWGANGINFRPLGSPQASYVQAAPTVNGAIVIFKEGVPPNESNTIVRGLRTDLQGNPVWDGSFHDLSDFASSKIHMDVTENAFGQVIAVWPDQRTDGGDIYLQNINPDGTLGDLNPSEPPTIEITAPSEGETVESLPVTVSYLVENFEVAEQGGDGLIEVRLNTQHYSFVSNPDSMLITNGFIDDWNIIAVELVDYNHQPLDPPVADSIWVNSTIASPSIQITAPEDSSEFNDVDIILRYNIENFEIAPENGDGLVHLHIRDANHVETDYYVSDPDSVDLHDYMLSLFWNMISAELVNYEHQPLNPAVLDSIHIYIYETSADDAPDLLPKRITLYPAYPNPFNPSTTLRFALPRAEFVTLSVYNVLGQEVARLAEGMRDAGTHQAVFDARGLAGGIYIYRLETPSHSEQRTMFLLK